MKESGVRRQARLNGWPFPKRPDDGEPAEAFRAWTRLYRRLRWALGTEVDLSANTRPTAKLARLRLAAKQRGLEVSLTRPDYEALLAGGICAYCGGPPPNSGHGIDRKDPTQGYTQRNVVIACDACNRIKSDVFSFEQMLEIGQILRRWRAEGAWKDPGRKDGRRWGGRPVQGNIRQEIEEWNRAHAPAEVQSVLARLRPSDGDGGAGQR